MIKISRRRENDLMAYIKELFTAYARHEKVLTMEDIIAVTNIRNNDVVLAPPQNILDFEILKDMIRTLARGTRSFTPLMVMNLYTRKEPELREVNIEKPQTTGLPLNFTFNHYNERESARAMDELNKIIEKEFGRKISLTNLWRSLPIKRVEDIKYIVEHIVVGIIQIESKEFRGSPWYDAEAEGREEGLKATTPKLTLIGYE